MWYNFSTMKNKQKGFVTPLLIGIIVILIIGGAIYFYENKKAEAPISLNTGTQQSNTIVPVNSQGDASGWQTYSYNDSYNNFSVQYPSGYVITDQKPQNPKTSDHTIIFRSPNWTQTKPISFALETWQAEGARTAAAQISMFSNPTYGSGLEKSNVNIGTISAVEFTDSKDPSRKASFLIFEKNGYTYTISETNIDDATFQKFYNSLSFK